MNVHGALNLETFAAPFVEPTTVDGVSAAQLLAQIEARNPDKPCQGISRKTESSHPSDPTALYCPHLNPIERLWAVIHQLVSPNRHHPTQKQFAIAILKFFRHPIPNE